MTSLLTGVIGATLLIASPLWLHAQQPGRATRDAQRHQLEQQRLGDADFVETMLRHDNEGIELARQEQQRGASTAVKALAGRIGQSLEKDKAQLQTFRASNTLGTSAREEHERMVDQHDQTLEQRLASLSGAALDRAFIDEMTRHHQMAIEMSGRASLSNAELRRLSEEMVRQRREQLKQLAAARNADAGK